MNKLYIYFFILGFGAWIQHLAIIAQTNYWKHFYGGNSLTYVSNSFLIAELAGSLISLQLSKHLQTRTFVYIYFSCTSLGMLGTVFLLKIQNSELRLSITILMAVINGAIAAMYFSNLIAASSRIDKYYAQAIQLGGGLSFFVNQLSQDFITLAFNVQQSLPQYSSKLAMAAFAYYSCCSLVLLGCYFVWKHLVRLHPVVNYTAEKLKVRKEDVIVFSSGRESSESSRSTKIQTIKYGLCLLSNHALTFALHPLFIVNIPWKRAVMKHHRVHNDNFVLAFLTVHQLANFLGRLLPVFKSLDKLFQLSFLKYAMLFRFFIGALLVAQNFPQTKIIRVDSSHFQYVFPVLTNVAVAFVSNAAFIFSATLVQTIALVQFQQRLTTTERTRASFVVNLFMQAGIALGGFIGICLERLLFNE